MTKGNITGLRIRGQLVEWTTLGQSESSVEMLTAKRVKLEGDESLLTDAVKMGSALRDQCPDLRGPVSLGIPPEKLLLRILQLPTDNLDEIRNMIKLQLDKLSPFPEDTMISSSEVLRADKDNCLVLITAAQKTLIEFMGTACRQTEIDLQRIDAEPMGWWRLLSDKNAIQLQGRHIILLLEDEGGIWIATQDGLPISFKTIRSGEGLSAEEWALETINELSPLLMALDLEHGPVNVNGIDFWHRGINPEPFLDGLKTEFPQGARVFTLDTLPTLGEGLARRMLKPHFSPSVTPSTPQQMVVDLTPGDWRTSARKERLKRILAKTSIIVLGMWFLIMLIFWGGYVLETRQLRSLEQHKEKLQKPVDEVKELKRRVKSFEQYVDRSRSALECLLEISTLLPEDVSLTSFRFRQSKNIALRGEALSVNPIYDFKQALDKVALFDRVEMGSIQPSDRKTATVQAFRITIFFSTGDRP